MKKQQKKPSATTTVSRVLDRALGFVQQTLSSEDTAIDLLERQHREVKALFKAIEEAKARPAKTKLFEQLAANLVAHDAIEREIFYPACERKLGMNELLGESLVEHGVVEFCLYQAERATKRDDFPFKCQVLSEMVLHHVKEEERELFPEVKRAFSDAELKSLGKRMSARFEQATSEDFRAPLRRNLAQVLAGALEPGKRASKARKQRRPSAGPKSVRRRRAA